MTASQKAAATGGAVSFSYDGDDYTIPPSEDWPIEVVESIEEGRVVSAIKALLGPEQYAAFRAGHSTVKDLNGLFDAAGEAVGTGN